MRWPPLVRRARNVQIRRGGRKPIGIIAEDISDVATLDILIRKIGKAPYSIRSFKGDGGGKIVGKCHAWSQNLRDQGCRYLLIVHDLDSAEIGHLRAKLETALGVSPIDTHLIVIPVREIEAWLLADHRAITKAMKLRVTINQIANPEAIPNAKEYLGRLIYTKSGHQRRYINTIDNAKIAVECVPTNLQRCRSFVPFHQFIRDHI